MEAAHLHLDTYRIIKNLEGKGFTDEQVEGILQGIEEIRLVGVTTKADLVELETALRKELLHVEKKIVDGHLDLQRSIYFNSVTKIGVITAIVAIAVAFIKLI